MLTNSKSKGNIGEAKSMARLMTLGNAVSIPFGDNERYDLVVESITGRLLKAQVKFSSQISANNSLEFTLKSSTNHTTNKRYSTYEDDIDIFLLYHTYTDKVYVLHPNQFKGKKSIFFRTTETKNGQSRNVNMAVDYELNTPL